MPPLWERRKDIPVLAAHFIQKFGGRSHPAHASHFSRALMLLENDPWMRNVRKLET